MSRDDELRPQASPPDYSAGLVVEDAKTASVYEPMVKVTDDHQRVYNVGDHIIGRIIITPAIDIPFLGLNVELRMEESLSIETALKYSSFTRVVTLDKYKVPEGALPEDGVFRTGQRYTIDYSVALPSVLPGRCTCDEVVHSRLLPSFGSKKTMVSLTGEPRADKVAGGAASVMYVVRAKIDRTVKSYKGKHGTWCQGFKYLEVRPTSYGPLPLLRLQDFRGVPLIPPEGFISTTELVRTRLMKKEVIGTVTLASSTHIEVSLARECASSARRIRVYFTGKEPPAVRCVRAAVNLLTFVSKSPLGYTPTKASGREKLHSMYSEKIYSQDMTACAAEWRQLPPEEIPDQIRAVPTKYPTWGTLLNVPFNFPLEDKRVVESYVSCLTSRQYEFAVTVGFSPGFASLSIPVVVSNGTEDVFRRNSSVGSATHSLAPYIDLRASADPLDIGGSPDSNPEVPSYEDAVGPGAHNRPADVKDSSILSP